MRVPPAEPAAAAAAAPAQPLQIIRSRPSSDVRWHRTCTVARAGFSGRERSQVDDLAVEPWMSLPCTINTGRLSRAAMGTPRSGWSRARHDKTVAAIRTMSDSSGFAACRSPKARSRTQPQAAESASASTAAAGGKEPKEDDVRPRYNRYRCGALAHFQASRTAGATELAHELRTCSLPRLSSAACCSAVVTSRRADERTGLWT